MISERLSQRGIEITMNGHARPDEISSLFTATGWLEEAQLPEEQLDQAFNHAYCNLFARDAQGGLIGMIRSSYDGMYVMMWNLVVHPDHRGEGLGFTLLRGMMGEMKERGHTSVVGLAVSHMVEHYEKIGLQHLPQLQVVSTNPTL